MGSDLVKKDFNSILGEISPVILIATLTAFLAAELGKTNAAAAVLLNYSTIAFSLGAIFYFFSYKMNNLKEWLYFGSPAHETLIIFGFVLFFIGVVFQGYLKSAPVLAESSTWTTPSALSIAILAVFPLLSNSIIWVGKKLEGFRNAKKKSRKVHS